VKIQGSSHQPEEHLVFAKAAASIMHVNGLLDYVHLPLRDIPLNFEVLNARVRDQNVIAECKAVAELQRGKSRRLDVLSKKLNLEDLSYCLKQQTS